MRLVCPNCDAQYEIADGMIPADGRDVQCSNCGHIWFESPADAALPQAPAPAPIPPAPAPDPKDTAPEPEAPAPESPADDAAPDTDDTATDDTPLSHSVSPEIADILREEAEHSRAARPAAGVESQPDLGLAAPAPKRIDHTADGVAHGASAQALPDIEEINNSLRNTPQASQDDAPKKRGGFWRGFLFVVVIALIALALYVFAPLLMPHMPDPGPDWLARYVAWVDAMRLKLDLGLQSLLNKS